MGMNWSGYSNDPSGLSPTLAGLTVSKNTNGANRVVFSNNSSGGSAYAEMTLSSNAGDFDFFANSTAGGGSTGINSGSGFTNGLIIQQFGAAPIVWRTNSADGLRLDGASNVVVGNAVLSTSATDGFLYITSSAGAPTGAATAYSGRCPIHIDTTGSKIYVRIATTWKSVAVA